MGRVSVSLVSSEHVIPFLFFSFLFFSSLPIKICLSSSSLLIAVYCNCKNIRHLVLFIHSRLLLPKLSSRTLMDFFGKTLSSLAKDPLFSTIITFCTLILLYFPTRFFGVVFSPILISTSFLLLSLLRLGAIQRSTQQDKDGNEREREKESTTAAVCTELTQEKSSHGLIFDDQKCVLSDSSDERKRGTENPEFNFAQQSTTDHDLIIDDHKWVSSDFIESFECETVSDVVLRQKSFYSDSFVEWDVRAPLEVIYEEYEGEEEEDDENERVSEEKREAQMAIIERYASLSKFYPETDSDISSEEDFLAIRDWDSPEHICFQWEGEEKEGMIEIELGQKKYSEVEEENLIEIDLFPTGFR